VSSANLQSRLLGLEGWRSDAVTAYSAGPRAEPWMMEAVMLAGGEMDPLKEVQCDLSDKKLAIQLRMFPGRLRSESLCMRVEWRTVSNALEKSRAMTRTKEWVDRSIETWCRRVIMALVVEPVGRKANWSEKDRS